MMNANVNPVSATASEGVPAGWVQTPRFRSVVWAAVLSGVIALSAAGYMAWSEADKPPVFGGEDSGIMVSSSASWAAMTLPEMVDQADLIITGQVMGSSAPYLFAEMPGASPTYWRDMYVHVNSSIKGTPQVALFDGGLVRERALDAFAEPEGEDPCVVVVRTRVDSYNGIGVSTGMGEVAAGTKALFFLYSTDDLRTAGSYRLQQGEHSIFSPNADGTYTTLEGPFTLEDVAQLAVS